MKQEIEQIEKRINRFQKTMEQYDAIHASGGGIQNIKESYYYKGRRDEAIYQKEQDKAIINELLEAINEDFFMRERNKSLIEKAQNNLKTN